MGIALIWLEGLAVALFGLALATAWAARGRIVRAIWLAFVFLLFLAPSLFLTYATFNGYENNGPLLRTTWIPFTLSWSVAFVFLCLFLMWSGFRRPAPGL